MRSGLSFLVAQSTLVELDAATGLRWAFWILIGCFVLLPGLVSYLVLAERKLAGRFQDRVGPNRVGPFGLLQPFADVIKLLTKEGIVPSAADQWIHLIAPVLVVMSAFLGLAVIPFGVGLAPVNLPSGIVYLVAVSGLSPLGIFLAGWSSRSKFSVVGAMRAVAQLVSYEIPQVLSMIPVVLWSGSLSLVTIFDKQLEQGWFIASPPGLIGFAIFMIAGIAEVNRAPFDLPEAESELIAGYHTEYSGIRFGLFFLAEYTGILVICCVATSLYLGGGTPFPFSAFPMNLLGESRSSLLLTNAILLAGFLAKVFALIFLIFWIRATLPRLRVDRLMHFAWKSLVPVSLANILLAALWFECVLRPGEPYQVLGGNLPGYVVGWITTGPFAVLLIVFILRFNRPGSVEPRLQPPSPHLPIKPRPI